MSMNRLGSKLLLTLLVVSLVASGYWPALSVAVPSNAHAASLPGIATPLSIRELVPPATALVSLPVTAMTPPGVLTG